MIEDFVASIDSAITNFAQNSYAQLASGLSTTLWLIAALIFVAMMINILTQAKEASVLAYVGWLIRAAIVIAMASTWSTFQPIAVAAQTLPDSISGAINGGTNVWQALDNIVEKCFDLSSEAFENADFGLSLTGAVLWVAGAIIGAFGTGLALIAKGGLAVAVGLAPIFISSLMSSGTSQIFGSWAKTVVGLIMVIVVLSGIVALIQTLFANEVANRPDVGDMLGLGRFLAVCIISIAMLTQIPSLASGMSGSIVAAASGLAVASGIAGGMKNAMSAANNAVRGGIATTKTSAAILDAAKDGTGVRDSASRAMAARRTIAHRARNMDSAGRQSYAAGQYRKQIKAARSEANN